MTKLSLKLVKSYNPCCSHSIHVSGSKSFYTAFATVAQTLQSPPSPSLISDLRLQLGMQFVSSFRCLLILSFLLKTLLLFVKLEFRSFSFRYQFVGFGLVFRQIKYRMSVSAFADFQLLSSN